MTQPRVHQLDAWGVIVDAAAMAPRLYEATRELAKRDTSIDAEKLIREYDLAASGKAPLDVKKAYCDNLEVLVWDAVAQGWISVSFDGVMYDDALGAIDVIARGGDRFSIATTGDTTAWLGLALEDALPGIMRYSAGLYTADKGNPQGFIGVACQTPGHIVTHTEDSAGVFPHMRTADSAMIGVYVDRKGKSVDLPEGVLSTKDMRTIDYVVLGR